MLILGGCAGVTVTHHIRLEYSEGDSLFVRKKAQDGILERVVIKTAHIGQLNNTPESFRKFGKSPCGSSVIERNIVYEDTLRALWNADQLISHTDAIALAKTALEELLAETIAEHCA